MKKIRQKIAFRVDASHDLGFGHLSRCLVLANELKRRMHVIFITKDTKEAVEKIKSNGFEFIKLKRGIGKKAEARQIKKIVASQGVNKILVDLKEEVSKGYIEGLKGAGAKTILLDNIGGGRKNADVVIYPVAHADKKYFKGIKGKLFYGWDYVIVDKKFFAKRKKRKAKPTRPQLLVSMGGSDVQNLTPRIINALKRIRQDFSCIVVIGPSFKHKSIKVNDQRFVIKKDVKNMAELMLSSDIGIIMFGVSAYEAAAARLPCLMISAKGRYGGDTKRFAGFGTVIPLGSPEQLTEKKISDGVKRLFDEKSLMAEMKTRSRKFLKPRRLVFEVI
jgi:spore coat polysaccharide biosynthesis protein SpsF